MQEEQGLHSFVPIAVAKAKETIIPDHKLTWPQIDKATHRLLQMKECGWEADQVNVHLQFWRNLSVHKWHHNAEDAARQALIVYQATYRRRWHDTLGTTLSFNLKYLDKEALMKIKFKITSKASHRHYKPSQRGEYHLTQHFVTHDSLHRNNFIFPTHPIIYPYPHSTGLHAPQPPLVQTHYTALQYMAPWP
jgi:hypothetical protein